MDEETLNEYMLLKLAEIEVITLIFSSALYLLHHFVFKAQDENNDEVITIIFSSSLFILSFLLRLKMMRIMTR